MTFGEILFLALVVGAATAFVLALGWASARTVPRRETQHVGSGD